MNIKLIVAFLACFSLGAQDDPGGWTKAKWGMTEAQIREAFPEARVYPYPRNPVNHFFGLDHITIGPSPITYRVEFIFKSGGLGSVKISLTDAKDSAPANINFLQGLREKYGEPTSVKVEGSRLFPERTWEWLLPQTVIILYDIPGLGLTVTYHQRMKSNQL